MSNQSKSIRKIFVSYRRDDNPEFVKRIRDWFIHKYGRDNVFMDFDSIPPFVVFVDYIRDRVRECDVMVAIIGPRWMELLKQKAQNFEDDYVRIELELGLLEQKLVAPVCILGTQAPRTNALPPSMREILNFNLAFLNDDRGFYEAIEHITKGVEEELIRRDVKKQTALAQNDIYEAMDRFWEANDSTN